MQPTLERVAGRKPGRPRIGRKAQSAVPDEIYEAVEKEAEARGCYMADVWREMIVEHGYPSWAARGAE